MKWSTAEANKLRHLIDSGVHPKQAASIVNGEFGNDRTVTAVKEWCRRNGMSYAHCRLESDASSEQTDITEQLGAARAEISQLRRRLDQAEAALKFHDRLIEVGREIVNALPPVQQPKFSAPKKSQSQETAILMVSDIHYGEVVDAFSMMQFNEYNCDIASERLKALAETVTDLAKDHLGAGYYFKECYVLCLGDWVSGNIHKELVEGAPGNALVWTINIGYIGAQLVRDLLMAFPRVHLKCEYGNHGRLTKEKRYKARYFNWDWVAYQYMAMFLADEIKRKRVTCEIPWSPWLLCNIEGYNFLLLHGDDIMSWNQIPWYGIRRTDHNLQELLAGRGRIHYMVLGHFHNMGTLDKTSGEIILNGSVKGGDEYSMGRLFSSPRPRQMFAGVHKDRGISFEFKIDVDRPIRGEPYKIANIPQQTLGDIVAGVA